MDDDAARSFKQTAPCGKQRHERQVENYPSSQRRKAPDAPSCIIFLDSNVHSGSIGGQEGPSANRLESWRPALGTEYWLTVVHAPRSKRAPLPEVAPGPKASGVTALATLTRRVWQFYGAR